MKIISVFTACIFFAPMLRAQSPVASGSAKGNPFLAHENTAEDLRKAIAKHPYTWEHATGPVYESVVFLPNGTAIDTYPGHWNYTFTWHTKNPQEIELKVAWEPTSIILKFSADYSSYAGLDFDGASPLKGRQILPDSDFQEASASTPPPVPAAAYTASGNATPTPKPPGENTTDDLRKAVTTHPYTWESGDEGGSYIKFKADRTGYQTTHGAITWRIRNAQEIEVDYTENGSPARVVMKFSADYSTYAGKNLDGKTTISGHQVTVGQQ